MVSCKVFQSNENDFMYLYCIQPFTYSWYGSGYKTWSFIAQREHREKLTTSLVFCLDVEDRELEFEVFWSSSVVESMIGNIEVFAHLANS